MTTKVTDSVMDLTDVRQDITIGFNDDAARQSKIVGLDTPTQDDEATSKKYVDDTIAALLAIQVPAGMGPLPWAGTSAPTGWLLCNGTTVSQITYAALFAAIGTTYNTVGEPAGTFRLPDTRGRFVLGRNTSGSGTNRVNRTQAQNLGQVSGQENYQLQLTHLPSHNHTVSINATGSQHIHSGATTDTEPNHNHSTAFGTEEVEFNPGGVVVLDNGSGVNKSTDADGTHAHNVTVPTTNSTHTHGGSIGFTAGNTAHENTPPFLTTNYIIKY